MSPARAPGPAPRTCGRAGRGRGGAALSPPTRPELRELRRNRAARPQRPGARRGEARRRQWERHWRRPRSSGPGWDRRPRHEPRSRTPRCAVRRPRRAASASPGPRPGAGDELPRLRMMVDCQVSRRAALYRWVWTRPAPTRRARGAVSTQSVHLTLFRVQPFLAQSGN